MKCEHKHIKSVNCIISCMDCGELLPIDWIIAREMIAKQDESKEAPKKTARKKVSK